MSGVLQKYADLRTHQDRQRTVDIQTSLSRLTSMEMETRFAGSAKLGNAFLIDSPGTPRCVFELVMNPKIGDSVATLYEGHPVFNTFGDYQRGREELIDLINDFADAGTLGVLIRCPVRLRPTHLRDLGLMQLVDLVRVKVARSQGATV